MLKTYSYLLVVLCLVTGVCRAGPVYDNTSVDTLNSVMFSTGYVQLGDQVQLAAPSHLASLETQFFNLGGDTTFDATLSFYMTGTLTQIGSSFRVTGLFIGAFESLNVAFSNLGGLDVPADVIAMLSIGNLSGDGDLGLNLFDGPTVGSSSNQSYFADAGAGLEEVSTLSGIDNVYFRISAVSTPTPTQDVPEPSTIWLVLALMPGLVCLRQRQVAWRA
jgi:hypothetical protein